jgi:hypothetical protein
MDDKKNFQRGVVVEKKEKPIKHKRTQQWGKGEITSLL